MNTYEYQKLRGLKRKLFLIDQRGGGCEHCGYKKNLSALEFHHKNKLNKESQLDMRKLSNSTMLWIKKEFKKCIVLCANCHRETHNILLTIENVRERVKILEEKIIQEKPKKNITKCIDCNKKINYTYIRCVSCKNINKRIICPVTYEILIKEIFILGYTNTAKKYNVSRMTIKRWETRLKIKQ